MPVLGSLIDTTEEGVAPRKLKPKLANKGAFVDDNVAPLGTKRLASPRHVNLTIFSGR